jgi:hypothetical protein
MRAAVLLSVFFVIGGIAALFGVPAIYVNNKPVLGVLGLATSLVFAAVPPLIVLGWRKMKSKSNATGTTGDAPPNNSLERTRER